jgi:DNA-damage-inducible protein J
MQGKKVDCSQLDSEEDVGLRCSSQKDGAMAENSVVRARIDEATKIEAAAVLASMGLSLSDAFRLLLRRVAAEKALPFEPLVPNAETVEAMREARAGGLPRFKTSAALLRELNAGD